LSALAELGGKMSIHWRRDAEEAKAEALRLHRPMLIDVFKVP
jgi:hypothetical protein